jgi:hypothetical protein
MKTGLKDHERTIEVKKPAFYVAKKYVVFNLK